MPQVSLDDKLYQQLRTRAETAGFASVDQYVADLLVHEVHSDPFDPETFFTPERMRQIDESMADMKAGNVHSSAEVWESINRLRDTWVRDNAVES